MSFVEWIFLLGGLAVVGPVIAHMLAKPRFRRLPFTMLRFLHTGQVESRSRRKLRDLLILLLRCAIIALIAMLFARPLWHTTGKPKETRPVYCLGLDNSMSMAYADGAGSYFEELTESAVDYIRSAQTDGLFNICALASGDWRRGLSKEQALAEVKALKIAPGSANVGEFVLGLGRANRAELPEDEISVLVVSDFTPDTLNQFVGIEEPTAVNSIDYEPIVSPKPVNNAAIIDAHVVGVVDGKLTLNATVVNYGQVEQNRQLIAKAGSSKSAPVDIDLLANQRRIYRVHIDTGAGGQEQLSLPVELSLSGDDGLEEDDTFRLAVYIPGRKDVNILLAGDESQMFLLKTAMDTLSDMSSYDTLRVKHILAGDLALSDLKWADVVVCSAVAERFGYLASGLRDFVKAGGRFICFVAGTNPAEATKQLWQQGVLAALPGKCIRERTYIQPKPCESQASDVDDIAARSLANYRIEKILLKGYVECEPHRDSQCLWQLQNGLGFVYSRRLGSGTSILVNTSVDDSLGSLTKSNASVAFCRYLLGQSNQIGEYCFAYDERIMLPFPDRRASSGGQKPFWVETCDGKRRRAAAADAFLLVPDPAGIGWVKTLGKQTMFAGINLPEGETNMTKPNAGELADMMDRVFPTGAAQNVSTAEMFRGTKRQHLWKVFAWAIILLLLVEPPVANRLRR